jgi:UDP-sulfoquinovose synthase
MKKYATNASKISAGSTGEFDHQIGIPIDENSISIEVDGLTSKNFMFPRHPNSLYHLSKISSTYMMNYISKIWNLSCTDVMQAVVFGSYTDDIDITGINTRIDSDESQGTVIHRFIVQACIGEPLTIYGEGLHQRGFLSLNDSIQAFMIGIKNPAKKGEYLTWNQLSSWSSINDISDMVVKAGNNMGLDVQKRHITSPRPEHTGTHYYNYITKKLADLGYRPTRTIEQEIEYTMKKVLSTIENDKTIIPILRKNVMPKIIF